ncbi:MAG: PDZ domain-containing protein [Promicromonosporaceae bacterium]|nr:PDZ domain-containing protein [Promicromonosporaceae bacterium]
MASKRSGILIGSLITTLVLTGAALVAPTGFAVRSPGPTADTLGEIAGTPLVQVLDAPTYPASGQLRLTTASIGGGPVSATFSLEVLRAWVAPGSTVQPREAMFPRPLTSEEQRAISAQQMLTSQQQATVAALTELGFVVPVRLTVAGLVEDSPAFGVVEDGDVLRSLNGQEIVEYRGLLEMLAEITPGDTVTLGVERAGEYLELTQGTGEGLTADGRQRAALGIWLGSEFDFPVDIEIQIDGIGGPSAGMVFALAIIDLMTPADLLGGVVVAGTGTIDVDGTVGPVGGIPQKLAGSARDGATFFLLPLSNCDAASPVPAGLQVVAVSTLKEALAAITAIGAGDTDALPACPTN